MLGNPVAPSRHLDKNPCDQPVDFADMEDILLKLPVLNTTGVDIKVGWFKKRGVKRRPLNAGLDIQT